MIVQTDTVKIDGRTYTIKVHHDEDCTDPLESDEGVHITCRKGARSEYGNTPLDMDAHQRIGERIELYGNKAAQLAEALRISEDPDYEPLGEPLIGLPVYVYEHSNVAMRTHAFTCRWDSGQSGFIYITEKTALDWQGGTRMSKGKLARVLKYLESVVEEYGMWCNGETYGYVIEDEEGKELDSCWGFIGMDYMMSEARAAAKSCHEREQREKIKRAQARARETTERKFWEARGVETRA